MAQTEFTARPVTRTAAAVPPAWTSEADPVRTP